MVASRDTTGEGRPYRCCGLLLLTSARRLTEVAAGPPAPTLSPCSNASRRSVLCAGVHTQRISSSPFRCHFCTCMRAVRHQHAPQTCRTAVQPLAGLLLRCAASAGTSRWSTPTRCWACPPAAPTCTSISLTWTSCCTPKWASPVPHQWPALTARAAAAAAAEGSLTAAAVC